MSKILENIERTFKPSESELIMIRDSFSKLLLKKGQLFLEEGQPCKRMGILEKGSMRLFYDSVSKEVCNDFYFENSVVGSIASFLSGQPSMVNIAAIQECELLVITKEKILELMPVCPPFARFIRFILQEQFIRAERRDAELLKLAPEERFLHLLEMHPKIFGRIPLYFIASYLNITPETLSRYRKKFTTDSAS